jgi:hypothetical protein
VQRDPRRHKRAPEREQAGHLRSVDGVGRELARPSGMRGQTITVALAAALGLGGIVFLVASGDAPRASRPGPGGRAAGEAVGPAELPPDAPLEDRVARLEAEVEALRTELSRQRLRPIAGPSGGDTTFDAEDLEDDAVADGVRAIIAQEREREDQRRNERRGERMAERASEALERLRDAAGLDRDQVATIDALWATERAQAMELFARARAGSGEFDEVRAQLERLREQTDAEVAELLDDEQVALYLEHRPGPGGGRRGGDGGPPGG